MRRCLRRGRREARAYDEAADASDEDRNRPMSGRLSATQEETRHMDAEQTIDHPGRAEVRGGVVAYLNLSNAGSAVDFYKRALAAEEAARIPADDGKRLLHAHLYINGGSVMIS